MSDEKVVIHIDDDDAVGYGKPPKQHRFKPGRSGNPRGRPKSVDVAEWEDPLQKCLLAPMTVTINGKKKTMSTVDALIKAAVGRALGGCPKHLKLLWDSSGGLKALIQAQKRQANQADLDLIEQARREIDAWILSEPSSFKSLP